MQEDTGELPSEEQEIEVFSPPQGTNKGRAEYLKLYHGTDGDFDVSELEPRDPQYDGSLGAGIYLGQNRETAEFYGKNVHEVYVRLLKPLIIDPEESSVRGGDGYIEVDDPDVIDPDTTLGEYLNDNNYPDEFINNYKSLLTTEIIIRLVFQLYKTQEDTQISFNVISD